MSLRAKRFLEGAGVILLLILVLFFTVRGF